MKISDFTNILFLIAVLFAFIYQDKSRQRHINRLQEEFKTVLSIVESLRFRVFDHERQLLEKEGVFVPEDVGMFAFNLMWSIIDDKTKKEVEDEYKSVCPEHIPLWKYVIYSYKFSPKFERKIELRKIETVEEILNGELKQTSEMLAQIKSQMEQVKAFEEKANDIAKEIDDIKSEVN